MRLVPLLIAAIATCCSQQSIQESSAKLASTVARDSLLEDVRILSADDMEGRLAGAPSGARARAYILDRFHKIGVQPVGDTGFSYDFPLARDGQDLTGVNLVGIIRGTSKSRQALLVMAHYDHVGVREGQIYNGADDNASGVAGLLAIATSLRKTPPAHDIILAATDAEEEGIQGARALVADTRLKSVLDRVVLAVNFDMLSRSDKNELYVSGAWHFPWLKPRLQAIAAKAPVSLLLGHDNPDLGHEDWTDQSDHVAFQMIHRPWVYFGVEDHIDYHQPTDDFGAIPQDFFRRAAATTEMAVRAFDADLEGIAADAAAHSKAGP